MGYRCTRWLGKASLRRQPDGAEGGREPICPKGIHGRGHSQYRGLEAGPNSVPLRSTEEISRVKPWSEEEGGRRMGKRKGQDYVRSLDFIPRVVGPWEGGKQRNVLV